MHNPTVSPNTYETVFSTVTPLQTQPIQTLRQVDPLRDPLWAKIWRNKRTK